MTANISTLIFQITFYGFAVADYTTYYQRKYGFEPKTKFDDEELKKRLTPQQYWVTQEEKTRRARYSQIYDKIFDSGKYNCVVCNEYLFSSEHKYERNMGMATFNFASGEVAEIKPSLESRKATARCDNCGSYLGHVFDDGAESENNKRYIINSVSLNFVKDNLVQDNRKDKRFFMNQ